MIIMRKKILYSLVGFIALLITVSCSENEKYSTSIVKKIDLYLNDVSWSVNTGLSTKPLFIYNENGEYFANYTSHYRFQLPNGKYKIISTTQSDMISTPDNINDLIIKQDPEARLKFDVSTPVEYNSPFEETLNLQMYSRTGVLRLRATDKKSDKSYTTVRAVVTTPISAYKVSDASYVINSTEIINDRTTTTGGINYTSDIVLFETASINESVSIRIDYLNQNSELVQSKMLDGNFTVLSNDTTQISFALNNENEPMIQNYTVTIASEGWTEEEFNPVAPMKIPEGYIYVNPEEDLQKICTAMMGDSEIDDVKLFLKAGGTYKLGRQTDLPKSLYIIGQKPKDGEELAYMEMGNMSISSGDNVLEAFYFENLHIKVTDSDFLKFKNQYFHVNEITLKNCEIRDLGRTMWYQEVNAGQAQTVERFVIDNCRFYGLNHSRSGFIGLSTKQDAPIHNIIFRNSTFHVADMTKALITGMTSMTGTLDIAIENCTFVALAPATMIFFDLDARKTSNFNLTVKNNLFSGITVAGSGQWFNLNNVTTRSFTDNYCTQDFVLGNWGVNSEELPMETSLMNVLFTDIDNLDFTIQDKSSDVYIRKIGDPHWIK